MQRKQSIRVGVTSFLSLSVILISVAPHVYSQSTGNPASINTNNLVSVSSSVTLHVSNQTFKANQGILRTAIIDFLNSGPNIFKAADSNQLIKTKLSNQVNNVTQIVEGLEASNAIVGVEITKALTALISSSKNQTQGEIITVQTSSACKQIAANSTSCENNIVLK